jgi:hypothetical protein
MAVKTRKGKFFVNWEMSTGEDNVDKAHNELTQPINISQAHWVKQKLGMQLIRTNSCYFFGYCTTSC